MALLGRTLTSGAQAEKYVRLLELASKELSMTVTYPPPEACCGVESTVCQAFIREFKGSNAAFTFYECSHIDPQVE